MTAVGESVKQALMVWCENTIKARFAEDIAAKIGSSARPCPFATPRGRCPDPFCRDCDRAVFAAGLAAMVRRMGGVV